MHSIGLIDILYLFLLYYNHELFVSDSLVAFLRARYDEDISVRLGCVTLLADARFGMLKRTT